MIDGRWVKFVKSVKAIWSIYRFTVPSNLLVLATIGCYRVGYVLSDQNDSDNLARSGAFATTLLILNTLNQAEKRVKVSEQAASAYYKERTKYLQKSGEQSQKDFDDDLAEKTEQMLWWSLKLPNALGLAVATLVWGFGSLAKDFSLITFIAVMSSPFG